MQNNLADTEAIIATTFLILKETSVTLQRIFEIADFVQISSDEEPVRSVVSESSDAVVVMWHLLPGQRIHPHLHPAGQDTWTVVSGQGIYSLDADAETKSIFSGQIVVAHMGQVRCRQ